MSDSIHTLRPGSHLLSPNSDAECTICMMSELTLHDICNYNKTIIPKETHQLKKSAILIPTREDELSSTPHKEISKQLFREEKRNMCEYEEKYKNT